MARYVNVCTIAFGVVLLVLVLAVPVFAGGPCRSFTIDAPDSLAELFDPPTPGCSLACALNPTTPGCPPPPCNLVGGKGSVTAVIDGEPFSAVLTLLRLGPKEDIPNTHVLDFFSLNAGHNNTLEASIDAVINVGCTANTENVPCLPTDPFTAVRYAFAMGPARVESGRGEFAQDAGVFFIQIHHQVVLDTTHTDTAHPISVHVNGKLCDER